MSTPVPAHLTPRPAVRRIATQTADEMTDAMTSGELDSVLPSAEEIRAARESVQESLRMARAVSRTR